MFRNLREITGERSPVRESGSVYGEKINHTPQAEWVMDKLKGCKCERRNNISERHC